jgi:hypothetical protein
LGQQLAESNTQLWNRVSNCLTVMSNNINRLRGVAPFAVVLAKPAVAPAANPVIAIPAGQPGAPVGPPRPAPVVTLSPSPATIHDLWAE